MFVDNLSHAFNKALVASSQNKGRNDDSVPQSLTFVNNISHAFNEALVASSQNKERNIQQNKERNIPSNRGTMNELLTPSLVTDKEVNDQSINKSPFKSIIKERSSNKMDINTIATKIDNINSKLDDLCDIEINYDGVSSDYDKYGKVCQKNRTKYQSESADLSVAEILESPNKEKIYEFINKLVSKVNNNDKTIIDALNEIFTYLYDQLTSLDKDVKSTDKYNRLSEIIKKILEKILEIKNK